MPKVPPPPGDSAEREHHATVRALTAAAATHDPEIAATTVAHATAKAGEHLERMRQRYEYRRDTTDLGSSTHDEYDTYQDDQRVGSMTVSHMPAVQPTFVIPPSEHGPGVKSKATVETFEDPFTGNTERGTRSERSEVDSAAYEKLRQEHEDPDHPQLFLQYGGQPQRSIIDNLITAQGHQAVGMTMVGMALDRSQRNFGNQLQPDDDLSGHSARLVGNPKLAGIIPADYEQKRSNEMTWLGQTSEGDVNPEVLHSPPDTRHGDVVDPTELRRGRDILRSAFKRSRYERIAAARQRDPEVR